jgi:hypothetical protein
VTYAPADLIAALDYLHLRGAPWDSLGCVGDTAHGAAGYHIGADLVPADDYSRSESSRDRSHTTDAAAAIDFSGAPWWTDLTLWLVDQCKTGAPGTEDIREIIYTPDGRTVRRWDRLGIRASGDDSHLYHSHLSFFRDSEGRRGGFVDLLNRYFNPADAATGEDPDIMSTGPIPAGYGADATQLADGTWTANTVSNWALVVGGGLGPVNGGQFGNRRCVLGLGCDGGTTDGVLLRVAVKADGKGWGVRTYTVKAAGNRVPIFLDDNVTKFSVTRARRPGETDGSPNATCPVWWDLEFETR